MCRGSCVGNKFRCCRSTCQTRRGRLLRPSILRSLLHARLCAKSYALRNRSSDSKKKPPWSIVSCWHLDVYTLSSTAGKGPKGMKCSTAPSTGAVICCPGKDIWLNRAGDERLYQQRWMNLASGHAGEGANQVFEKAPWLSDLSLSVLHM
jgi:hypothetical protein